MTDGVWQVAGLADCARLKSWLGDGELPGEKGRKSRIRGWNVGRPALPVRGNFKLNLPR